MSRPKNQREKRVLLFHSAFGILHSAFPPWRWSGPVRVTPAW
jgi:hypothetical protein